MSISTNQGISIFHLVNLMLKRKEFSPVVEPAAVTNEQTSEVMVEENDEENTNEDEHVVSAILSQQTTDGITKWKTLWSNGNNIVLFFNFY